ncbi:hypothetical protein TIFTF001_037510 [Ficus carica]|uniref:Secreted protein n=1 Tax=Ficus carica TaxID=3494 RepID=A0AA88J911_FICCA|nr:hypothetical protein TIFTF001_040075 [Ficus carica]GMN21646.1 hypothetical protein TIFTF001_040078 [Ficus carica]GMN68448.1 hypothetical protein TIFTF001_037505 [Ficus carica]GMN68454.1 hypothetical protein TIFTF001_037510 [Ficus carica]
MMMRTLLVISVALLFAVACLKAADAKPTVTQPVEPEGLKPSERAATIIGRGGGRRRRLLEAKVVVSSPKEDETDDSHHIHTSSANKPIPDSIQPEKVPPGRA